MGRVFYAKTKNNDSAVSLVLRRLRGYCATRSSGEQFQRLFSEPLTGSWRLPLDPCCVLSRADHTHSLEEH